MTTITITPPRALLVQALNALQLPCDRWNGVQSKIVKAAADAVQAELAQPVEPTAARQQQALRDCIGAIEALLDQVGQMKGLFHDDDGTIADAEDAGLEAIKAATEALT